jgi:hypothetical protein
VAKERPKGSSAKYSKEKAMSNAVAGNQRRRTEFADLWPNDDERPDSDDGVEPADESDVDFDEIPFTDDDSRWEAFIPDEDEFDPVPDPGDFWTE